MYRSDKDVYIYTAASILHKYYENVTKDERSNPGKVATLACIAEGSLVLTDHGLVPIEKVSCGMRVWDGVEWVAHDGPVYRGMKEVIEHDGLQATPDHMVFTEEGKAVELQEATRTQQRLAQTGSGRSPIRLGEDNFSRHRNAKPAETACSMLQTKRPVWDILNAGPRHRFTVSGKLVHNCGYGGGAGAVRKFNGHELIEEELKRQGLKGARLEEKVNERILEQIVRPWREAHPRTVQFWGGLETACVSAVREPGKVCFCRAVGFRVQNRFLMCRLPSGRLLYYYDPKIEPSVTSWGETKDSVTYMTVDGMTKKWIRANTYGGKLAENVTQAICRDLMAEAMLRVEKAGYEIVLTVHDELVCEVPEGFGSVEELEKLMCIVPPWAAGFPVKAEGWRGKRYKK